MRNKDYRRREIGRSLALESGDVVLHALQCDECQIRPSYLYVLAELGWTEHDFYGAYFEYLLSLA
jgi:hypothetical protein